MKFISILILVLLFSGRDLTAQGHEPDNHHHPHPKNEIGLGNYFVYLASEKESSYGLHLHYLRSFEESKFGIGLGYEQIFGEHDHKTLGIVGSYRPISPLGLSLSPGVLFPGGERSTMSFALHAEAVYEFEINNFHLGPAIEFAYASNEIHISFGLHLAYGF
jgi:hypothetical protein